MAITRNVALPVTKEEERLERVVLAARPDGTYSLQVHRQVLGKTAQNVIVAARGAQHPIARASSVVKDETATLASGTVIRLADIVEALDILSDRWSAQDEAERNTPLTAPEPIVGERFAGRPALPASGGSPLQGVGRN
jgi:hypothetical protein